MSSRVTLAAGCFWSVELLFQRVKGVLKTRVGYCNGTLDNPTYRQVCTGKTGHAEAVDIEYDSKEISFKELLDLFWSKHDPTTLNRQGNDVGTQYRSGIFYYNDEQKQLAQESLQEEQKKYKNPITTEISPAGTFYPAEEEHQKYLEKGGQCASKGCKDNIRCYG